MKLLARLASFVALLMLAGCATVSSQPGWYQYHNNPKPPESVFLQHDKIPLYIDTNFSAVEMTQLGNAIKEWNVALNGTMELVIMEKQFDHTDPDQLKEVFNKINTTYQGFAVIGANSDDDMLTFMPDGVLAFCNDLGDKASELVLIKDRMGTRNVETILKHELGHLLGSEHTQSSGLLFPYYSNDQYPCIDKITLSNVASYHHLPLENMNWCRVPNFE